MPGPDATDEQLLVARDAASFELFYVRHVDAMLGFFARRTFDAEIAADMRAETFAAALASRRRFSPGGPPARAWLFGIGAKMLADAQRRGYADMRARRRLGMERI
jgi:DNA-directed RNA polymerase specialized sigma24 family protein